MNLSDLSLKRPVMAIVLILALVSLGLFSYMSLNIDEMPKVDLPYVMVTILQPGVSPEQMEKDVARKIEDAVGQVSGVKHIYTFCYEGQAIVAVEFTLETPSAEAVQNVRDKISAIRGELPQDIEEPVVAKIDINSMPVVSLAVSGSAPVREMTQLVDDIVVPRLERVNGVGKVAVYGAEKREIQIKLDKNKLAMYGLTNSEILNSLKSQNLDIPAGKLSNGNNEVTLRTEGKIDSVEQFKSLPVARKNGVQLYVRDIAEVDDGIKEQDNLARVNGLPAIGIDVTKQSDSNTVAVVDEVKKAVAELQQQLPPGVKIELVRDNSVRIRESVDNVIHTIYEGGILAVLIIFLFLKDWRSTLISALALPSSIISTFLAFKIMGFTMNTMTLAALSLAVGLLIDDAIVVIENIARHLRMGKTPLEAARDGTAEISLPVLATTMTVVAVFLPVAVMTGITGRFFKEFGVTVVFAVLVSLLVSFTLVPVLSARLKKREQLPVGLLSRFLNWFNGIFEHLSVFYGNMLTVALKRRALVVVAVLTLLFGSFSLLPRLGMTFIPDQDNGELSIVADLDSGLSLSAAEEMNKRLLSILEKYPEVKMTYSTIKNDQINLYMQLEERQKRSRTAQQIAADLRNELRKVPGMRAAVNVNSSFGGEKTVTFYLLGDDSSLLQAYAEKAQKIMEDIPGVVDVGSSFKPGKPEIQVKIKQDAASDLGVSVGQIGDVLHTLFGGVVASHYEEGGDRFDVRVRLGENDRQNVNDLNNIYLQGQYANLIPLSQVTETKFASGSSELRRYDKAGAVELSANLDGLSLGDFNKIFLQRVERELKMPAGYRLIPAGQAEMMGESMSTMGIAMILGVLFMFFILAAQFESFIDPFAIILSLPLALIGAVLGLYLGGSQVSMIALIGVIMLMGLVAKNAILLIDFAKNDMRRGVQRSEALLRAARTRFRPIMMTSMAMIFGMVPNALGIGTGAEMRAPMAYVIIGGMITSTLLTLVVVPVIYSLLDDVRNFVSKRLLGRGKEQQAFV